MADTTESELKVVLTGDETGLKDTFDQISKDFKVLSDGMALSMKDLDKQIKASMDPMNDKLGIANQLSSTLNKQITGLKNAVNEGFGDLEKALGDNNAMLDMAIRNMVNLANQTRQMKQAVASRQGEEENLAKTIFLQAAGFATMYQAVHTVMSAIKATVSEMENMETAALKIASITGESMSSINNQIVDLAAKTGSSMQVIETGLQHAANEGITLKNNFDEINAAAIISRRNMVDFGTEIDTIHHLVDIFGVSADKVFSILIKGSLTGEAQQTFLGRIGKDAKEAGFNFNELTAITSVLMNEAGMSGRALQSGLKEIFGKLKDLNEEQQELFKQDLLHFRDMTDAQKNMFLETLHLKDGNEIIRALGERIDSYNSKVIDAANNTGDLYRKLKDGEALSFMEEMRATWDEFVGILDKAWQIFTRFASAGISSVMEKVFGVKTSELPALHDYLKNVNNAMAESVRQMDAIANQKIASKIGELRTQIAEQRTLIQNANNFGGTGSDPDGTKANAEKAAAATKIKDLEEEIVKIEKDRVPTIQTIAVEHQKVTNAMITGLEKGKDVSKDLSSQLAMREKEYDIVKNRTDAETGHIAALRKSVELYEGERQKQSMILQDATEMKASNQVINQIIKDRAQVEDKYWQAKKALRDAEEKETSKGIKAEAKEQKDFDDAQVRAFKEAKDRIQAIVDSHHASYEWQEKELVTAKAILLNIGNIAKQQEAQRVAQEAINAAHKKAQDLTIQSNRFISDREQTMRDELSVINHQVEVENTRRELSKGLTLTENAQLVILKKEIDYEQLKLNARIHGLSIYQLEEQHKKTMYALEDKLRKANDQARAKSIEQEMDQENKEFLSQVKQAEALQKLKDDYHEKRLKQHYDESLTMKDLAESTGRAIESTVGAAVQKLLFNTGSLKTAWEDLAKSILADVAKKGFMLALQYLSGQAFGSEENTFGGFLMKALGGAHGTSLTGVPGYAMGSPISGVDSVPALLSPGEIVLDNNASDMFRSMISHGGSGGQPITIVIQSAPSLLGSREELIRLDNALNNPIVRTATDRRKV